VTQRAAGHPGQPDRAGIQRDRAVGAGRHHRPAVRRPRRPRPRSGRPELQPPLGDQRQPDLAVARTGGAGVGIGPLPAITRRRTVARVKRIGAAALAVLVVPAWALAGGGYFWPRWVWFGLAAVFALGYGIG